MLITLSLTNAYSQPELLEWLINNAWAKLSVLVTCRSSLLKVNTLLQEQGGNFSSPPCSARANSTHCSLQTLGHTLDCACRFSKHPPSPFDLLMHIGVQALMYRRWSAKAPQTIHSYPRHSDRFSTFVTLKKMFSLCLSVFAPSQHLSFLSEGQHLALVSNVWQGKKTDIFPCSHLQMGVILRRTILVCEYLLV